MTKCELRELLSQDPIFRELKAHWTCLSRPENKIERAEMLAELCQGPYSQRMIAEALGVDEKNVRLDLKLAECPDAVKAWSGHVGINRLLKRAKQRSAYDHLRELRDEKLDPAKQSDALFAKIVKFADHNRFHYVTFAQIIAVASGKIDPNDRRFDRPPKNSGLRRVWALTKPKDLNRIGVDQPLLSRFAKWLIDWCLMLYPSRSVVYEAFRKANKFFMARMPKPQFWNGVFDRGAAVDAAAKERMALSQHQLHEARQERDRIMAERSGGQGAECWTPIVGIGERVTEKMNAQREEFARLKQQRPRTGRPTVQGQK